MLLKHRQGLVEMGLISFVAVAQLLPGIFGVLYWPRATWQGFVCGLLAGIGFWSLSLLLPLLETSGLINAGVDLSGLRELSGDLGRWELPASGRWPPTGWYS